MEITRTSITTGITRTKDIDVTPLQLERINNGELIQNVLSHLSEEDREFILTGITQQEWDDAFAEEDDE